MGRHHLPASTSVGRHRAVPKTQRTALRAALGGTVAAGALFGSGGTAMAEQPAAAVGTPLFGAIEQTPAGPMFQQLFAGLGGFNCGARDGLDSINNGTATGDQIAGADLGKTLGGTVGEAGAKALVGSSAPGAGDIAGQVGKALGEQLGQSAGASLAGGLAGGQESFFNNGNGSCQDSLNSPAVALNPATDLTGGLTDGGLNNSGLTPQTGAQRLPGPTTSTQPNLVPSPLPRTTAR